MDEALRAGIEDGDCGDEETAALEAALRMNQELKDMEKTLDNRASVMSVRQSYQAGSSRMRGTGAALSPVKRTFTKAPETAKLNMNRPKQNYTHNDRTLGNIAKENQLLADKLLRINVNRQAPPTSAYIPQYLKVASVAPATINRGKKQTAIDKENARLLSRIQSVKPDKSLNGRKQAKDFQQHQKYAENCRKTPTPKRQPRPEWQE